jgi:hypothetical protein
LIKLSVTRGVTSTGSGSVGARRWCDWVGAGEMGHVARPVWKGVTR